MARRKFWRGFAAGAAAGAGAGLGAVLLPNLIGQVRNRQIVRLEKALQVGRPVEEVFNSWTNLEGLPQMSDCIREVTREGNHSHWRVQVDGKQFEWDATIEQFIPNQAVGWKTLRGPKHTGRITFAPVGKDTLVQVTMNYAPPLGVLRPFSENLSGRLEKYLDQVLRDFKASLEGKGQEGRKPPVRSEPVGPGTGLTQTDVQRATGTLGSVQEVVDRFGNRPNPVEYTAPPEAKR